MKALSIMQPWAWLIVNGHKPIENRNWKHNNPGLRFRGPVLIHAGKKYDQDGADWINETFPKIILPSRHPPHDLLDRSGAQRGGIVGIAIITDCVTQHDSPWFFGPYGFVLANARPLPFRPLRGQLGFFNVDW